MRRRSHHGRTWIPLNPFRRARAKPHTGSSTAADGIGRPAGMFVCRGTMPGRRRPGRDTAGPVGRLMARDLERHVRLRGRTSSFAASDARLNAPHVRARHGRFMTSGSEILRLAGRSAVREVLGSAADSSHLAADRHAPPWRGADPTFSVRSRLPGFRPSPCGFALDQGPIAPLRSNSPARIDSRGGSGK